MRIFLENVGTSVNCGHVSILRTFSQPSARFFALFAHAPTPITSCSPNSFALEVFGFINLVASLEAISIWRNAKCSAAGPPATRTGWTAVGSRPPVWDPFEIGVLRHGCRRRAGSALALRSLPLAVLSCLALQVKCGRKSNRCLTAKPEHGFLKACGGCFSSASS